MKHPTFDSPAGTSSYMAQRGCGTTVQRTYRLACLAERCYVPEVDSPAEVYRGCEWRPGGGLPDPARPCSHEVRLEQLVTLTQISGWHELPEHAR